MNTTSTPQGYNTVNPFVITKDAKKYIEFVKTVFGATETKEAFTVDTDGLVLHAELKLGDATILLVERKPDWPLTPGLLQVYVKNVATTLKRAEEHGAKVITKPTDFFGDLFSRFIDPFGNLWWVYQHRPQAQPDWSGAADTDDSNAAWEPTKEMRYIHETLLEAMKSVRSK